MRAPFTYCTHNVTSVHPGGWDLVQPSTDVLFDRLLDLEVPYVSSLRRPKFWIDDGKRPATSLGTKLMAAFCHASLLTYSKGKHSLELDHDFAVNTV